MILKLNRNLILVFILNLLLINCGPKIPVHLLEQNQYEEAIRQGEILHRKKPDNKEIATFLGKAYFQAALESYEGKNYKRADSLFEKAALFLDKKRIILFYRHLIKGHLIAAKGGKQNFWLAINEYKNARILMPETAEPYFWIAETYEKIDRNDFEPIIANYKKALEFAIDQHFKEIIQEKLNHQIEREATLRKFWGGENPYKQ